jgi:hypothetical protein
VESKLKKKRDPLAYGSVILDCCGSRRAAGDRHHTAGSKPCAAGARSALFFIGLSLLVAFLAFKVVCFQL